MTAASQDTAAVDKDREALWELVDGLLQNQRLILASNRGPVEYHAQSDGQLQPRRGSGGVVTALSGMTNHVDFTWIASAMGEGDRRVAEQHEGEAIKSPLPGQQVSVRYVSTSRRVYHKYYNIICNPLLWFLQHYMWSSPYTPKVDRVIYDAWDNGYVKVNHAFAIAILEEANRSDLQPLVMVHDYQLYLVPGMIREDLPNARIHQFIHIPWPSPSYWELVPAFMRTAICESLCQADIVGFQTERDARSFMESVETFVPDAVVNHATRTVQFRDRKTLIRAYPISIDVEEVRRIALSPRAQEYEQRLTPLIGKQTIIRVDRAEPSKNIVRGFNAYSMLLEEQRELHGQVRFLAFLVPSRTHIRQYQRYLEEIEQVVRQINEHFGTEEWQPIQVFFENNYIQAIAAMQLYDVLLVNSVVDGMNLVAKEGPVVNKRNGVLVLSESAGAHERLQVGSLPVAPADIEGTKRALLQALAMNPEERRERNNRMVKTIEQQDIINWLFLQLQDISTLA
jgi:trehalose 6-phosphate synthase